MTTAPSRTQVTASAGSVWKVGITRRPFRTRRPGLAASDAHRLQRVASAAAAQLVREGGQDAGSGGTDGVAEGDAGAVGVEPFVRGRDVPLAQAGQHLGGERLVQFDE